MATTQEARAHDENVTQPKKPGPSVYLFGPNNIGMSMMTCGICKHHSHATCSCPTLGSSLTHKPTREALSLICEKLNTINLASLALKHMPYYTARFKTVNPGYSYAVMVDPFTSAITIVGMITDNGDANIKITVQGDSFTFTSHNFSSTALSEISILLEIEAGLKTTSQSV